MIELPQRPKYRFLNAARSEQKIRAAGPVVFLTGKTRTTVDVGGQTRALFNAFVTAWHRQDDAWKLLHWQATKLPEGEAAA